MSQFVLTCESTADMTQDFFDGHKIPFACFSFNMGGEEYLDDYGKSMPIETFYQRLMDGEEAVTSQINAERYCEMFEPALKEGKDVVHITLSSGISGTYNSAMIAKEMMEEKYVNQKVHVIDGLGASSGYGLMVTSACKLRDEDKTAEEAVEWIEEHKLNVHHWFFSTDLTSYLRGGRISATSAWFGTKFHICPLMNMDDLGRLIPRYKVRGKKNVKVKIVEKMEELCENGNDYNDLCYISHADCLEDAEDVRNLIEEKFPNLKNKVMINSIGTVIGSHTGRGTVALYFMGEKRVR